MDTNAGKLLTFARKRHDDYRGLGGESERTVFKAELVILSLLSGIMLQ